MKNRKESIKSRIEKIDEALKRIKDKNLTSCCTGLISRLETERAELSSQIGKKR